MSDLSNRVAIVMGLGIAVNGIIMLLDPAGWYSAVPGLLETGPMNPHFVRDLGAAYLAAGAALLWFGVDVRARIAAFVGAAFLSLVALVHAAEALGRDSFVSAFDLLNVIVPATIALWAVWPDDENRSRYGTNDTFRP